MQMLISKYPINPGPSDHPSTIDVNTNFKVFLLRISQKGRV
jgi:hypothetical protein